MSTAIIQNFKLCQRLPTPPFCCRTDILSQRALNNAAAVLAAVNNAMNNGQQQPPANGAAGLPAPPPNIFFPFPGGAFPFGFPQNPARNNANEAAQPQQGFILLKLVP